MRILFGCSAGDGHFMPLLPLARAAAAAGHEVAFATAEEYRPRAEREGFAFHAVGISAAELHRRAAPLRERLRTGDIPVDERRVLAFSIRFGEIEAPAKVDDVYETIGRWPPDVLVHESSDLASPLAAAAVGIASVHHGFGRVIPPAAVRRAAEVLAPQWERFGLEPDEWAGEYRGAYVDICPPSLQDDAAPEGTPVQRLRPAEGRRADPGGRPLVYVTLGTIFNRPELLRTLLDAFSTIDCDVLMTVGADVDPAALGSPPANARVERYLPQAEILPRATAVVAHGGSGSTFGALAHGCPILFVPQGADQFDNAKAVGATGAGRVLFPDQQTVDPLRVELEELLGNRSYRDVAARLAAEIAAMPSAEQAASALFGA